MTDEERAKQVLYDLTMREKELSKERKELSKIGSFLEKMGRDLRERPECVVFGRQAVPLRFRNIESVSPPINAFSEDYLKQKTGKIRELIEAIEDLKREKRDLGL